MLDRRLADDGRPLNEKQNVELVRTALLSAEGLEAEFVRQLRWTLETDGVETWGASDG